MSKSKLPKDPNPDTLQLVIENVFVPPRLPQEAYGEQTEQSMNVELCDRLVEATQDFLSVVSSSERPLWMHMVKMMKLARCVAEGSFAEAELRYVFSNMAIGGMPI